MGSLKKGSLLWAWMVLQLFKTLDQIYANLELLWINQELNLNSTSGSGWVDLVGFCAKVLGYWKPVGLQLLFCLIITFGFVMIGYPFWWGYKIIQISSLLNKTLKKLIKPTNCLSFPENIDLLTVKSIGSLLLTIHSGFSFKLSSSESSGISITYKKLLDLQLCSKYFVTIKRFKNYHFK